MRSTDGPSRREVLRSVGFFVLTWLSVWLTYSYGQQAAGVPDRAAVLDGLVFATSLLSILLAHEAGHYLVARAHGFSVSLPTFLPVPFAGFGTLGAFIHLRSPPPTRQALLEMGAAGPLSGAVVAIGLLTVFLPDFQAPIVVAPGTEAVYFNDPLIAKLIGILRTGSVPALDAVYHPAAFAGWAGCLLTGFNLVPLGQLDGGHVLGAVFPDRARQITRFLVITAFAGSVFYLGWAFTAGVLLLLGITRPVEIPPGPLPLRSRVVAGLILALFVLTFIPVPVVGQDLASVLGRLLGEVGGPTLPG